jgi:pilus assembly protein Flp/PilA
MRSCRRFLRKEDGQDVAEYGLLVATVAIVVLLGTAAFGTAVTTWFTGLPARITTTGTR